MKKHKKIITIVGARPQFVKAAAVSRVIARCDNLTEALIHTGQHFDPNMSDVFFDELEIPQPTHNLDIKASHHGAMTGRQLESIEEILLKSRPDVVLLYGDTNSTLSGALAASKLGIPIAHIEAGLRSWNRAMPEEINRVLTDHVSSILFAPNDSAVENLSNEGINRNVFNVGDVMLDVALFSAAKAKKKSDIINKLNLNDKRFRLCTVHRQENTDIFSRLETIFRALRIFAVDTPVILPLHPRTRKALNAQGVFGEWTKNLTVIDPVGFLDIVALLHGAEMVITDSGGLQKEAYFHKTPSLILRSETEWTDLLRLGWARLADPTSDGAILQEADRLLVQHRDTREAPFGDGRAAQKIVRHLMELTE